MDMTIAYGALAKGGACLVAGTGVVASGVGVGSLIEPALKLTIVEKNTRDSQELYDDAEARITYEVEVEGTNLFLLESWVSKDGKADLKHMHDFVGGRNENKIVYMVNAKGDNIRLSIKKPTDDEVKNSFYTGWTLTEFSHIHLANVYYGFCSPRMEGVDVESKDECEHLPEG